MPYKHRTFASTALVIAACAMITFVAGCDELGLSIGPGTMPDPIPLDQTAAAAVTPTGTISTPAEDPSVAANEISSPSDVAANGGPEADAEPPPTEPTRERMKTYREWTVTETAIDSLGRLGEKAVPPLIESLDDPNPLVRYRAARVLSRIGPDAVEAVPALVRHLSDVDESVRREAARAIGQIGPEASEAVPHLINALKSDG